MKGTNTSLRHSHNSFTSSPPLSTTPNSCSNDSNILDCWLDNEDNGDTLTIAVISIFLPFALVAIYSLYSQVRRDHVAPIFVINLLLSDMIQISYMIVKVVKVAHYDDDDVSDLYFELAYFSGLVASCFFMIFIALERYLVIAWPLWYRFKRTIKASVLLCVATWIVSFVFPLVNGTNIGGFVLLLLPFLVFFLVGTLRALSAAQGIPTGEKRRIVATLVVVLLIYVLMFLPRFFYEFFFSSILCDYSTANPDLSHLFSVACNLIQLNPLTDLFLYIFIKKWAVDKLLAVR